MRSKKSSITKAEQRLKDSVYFVDVCLGKQLVETLRTSGLQVEAHLDHFAGDCPDIEWLPVAASRDWVVLSKDKMYRKGSIERKIIMTSKVKLFILTTPNCNGADFSSIYMSHFRNIGRILINNEPPFIARVSRNDIVLVDLDADNSELLS